MKKIKEAKLIRPQFGRFFYRFPDGESGADVYDRVSAFLGTFHRDMQQVNTEMNENIMDDATALVRYTWHNGPTLSHEVASLERGRI